MAPISSRMRRRYDSAVQSSLDILYGNIPLVESPLEEISELKGMFNRCVRQDQWDWFSVHSEFGNPPIGHMQRIANNLLHLRRAISSRDFVTANMAKRRLIASNLLLYLENYQNSLSLYDAASDTGWVYILSTREQPDVLKIGMTRRSIAQRVNEINGATGVLFPFSARRVFRVKDLGRTEHAIHILLNQYRLRPDREFFLLPFAMATKLIEDFLNQSNQRWRKRGEIVWFDPKKRYGFIAAGNQADIFVHASEVRPDELTLFKPKVAVEFELSHQLLGPCAYWVRLLPVD